MSEINFFAETIARGSRQKFGIKLDDRRRHMYVIGKTGMGKSQMLQNMAIQDIQAGRGVGVIDPHGEFAEALLDHIPANRINDVIYINPADTQMPIGFNIMESVGAEQRYFIASGLMAAFKKIWVDVWSARMEYILNNALLALLEYPNSTIMGANRMLADKDYRKKIVDNVKDPAVKSYWINEFAKYPERYREEATSAIQNKIGQFISNPLIRNMVGQTKSTFNVREAMDNQKILILNLSKGRIGEDNTALLGTMLITKIQIAAMSRVDVSEEDRKDFFLYVDEFQTFATPSFASILSEARKYRLSLILAHQYIAQMDEVVRDAVFGNAGTLICFRVGAADAEFLESEFTPSFLQEDIVNLTKYHIALKLMIDGMASKAFSAQTLPPILPSAETHREKIILVSRERYGKQSEKVEEKITKWSGLNRAPQAPFPPQQAQNNFPRQERVGALMPQTRYDNRPRQTSPPPIRPLQQSFSQPPSSQVQAPQQRPTPQASNLNFPSNPQKQKTRAEYKYTGECVACKREVNLNFQPAPGRPVYCRECFMKKKQNATNSVPSENNSKETISLKEAMKRFPPKQLESSRADRNPLTAKTISSVNTEPGRRKEVDAASLRESLRGIIKEGEKINF